MAKNRAPSFQFYPGDYMSDPEVQSLTWEQRGRYHWSLCCSALTDTPGIAHESSWARWMGYDSESWEQVREVHARCFRTSVDGTWIQSRLRDEKKEQRARFLAAKEAGRVSGVARRLKTVNETRTECERNANGMRTPREGSTPSSSSSSSVEPREPSLPLATLVEGGTFGPVDSDSIPERPSPAGPAEHAGAGNGASSGASGGRDTAAGLRTIGSILGGFSARLGMQNAQEGPQRATACAIDTADESEAKSDAIGDPERSGSEAKRLPYVDPVYEITKAEGGAVSALALSLCGKLWKHGLHSVPLLRGIARHWLDHRETIRNPFAYYGPGGEHWPSLSRQVAALDAIADHREQEIATWRFLESLR